MTRTIRDRVQSGAPVLGTWAITTSPTVAEAGSRAGLDFQILDMEHGPYDLPSLEACIRACELGSCAPLVRVPALEASIFQSVLDLGAHGVIVPQIKSARDAAQAVKFAKFSPMGQRGYNPFTRAANYANPSTNQTGKLANEFGLLGVIIENEAAYADLDAILEIDEIDMIYLGVYDMSVALGVQGDTQAQAVKDFVSDATHKILAAGKAVGQMVRSPEEIEAARSAGVTFLVYSVDTHVIYQAFQKPVRELALAILNGYDR